tara:strand:- start:61 stop:219 length:159 start_codon:yes stop_codon:yes gene_type:complete
MNLKERGITVGDLLVVLVFVVSVVFINNKVKEGEKQALLNMNSIEILSSQIS